MARSIDSHSPTCDCPPCKRKRTGDLSAKEPRLTAQVSHEEAELVRQAAAREGLAVNAWLRRLIQERFREELGLGDGVSAQNGSG